MTETMAYFDCFSGASGDMILGALVDAGLPLDTLSDDLSQLPCGPIQLRAETVLRAGIRATKITVDTSEARDSGHRGLREIQDLIRGSPLSQRVQDQAIRIFERLAAAEAHVHGLAVDQVHFHEVGALDAIADIVGAVSGLQRLGVDRVLFSSLSLGGGSVEAAHGWLPVPAPATAYLVSGFRCEMGPVQAELLTPTAAAILTTLGSQEAGPPFRLDKVGSGAGHRDHPGHPNVLRVMLGQAVAGDEADQVWVLEANLDDATPEMVGHAIECLLAVGALDAYALPIQMKKSRPGLMLCAIAGDETRARVEDVFFRETTTFGVRRYRVERSKLLREMVSVETPYGPVRVKVGKREGEIITVSPEFDDCRRIALERGLPLREIIELARQAFADHKKSAL